MNNPFSTVVVSIITCFESCLRSSNLYFIGTRRTINQVSFGRGNSLGRVYQKDGRESSMQSVVLDCSCIGIEPEALLQEVQQWHLVLLPVRCTYGCGSLAEFFCSYYRTIPLPGSGRQPKKRLLSMSMLLAPSIQPLAKKGVGRCRWSQIEIAEVVELGDTESVLQRVDCGHVRQQRVRLRSRWSNQDGHY